MTKADGFYTEFKIKELHLLGYLRSIYGYSLCESIKCHANFHENKNDIVIIFVNKVDRRMQILDEEILKIHLHHRLDFPHIPISEMAQRM